MIFFLIWTAPPTYARVCRHLEIPYAARTQNPPTIPSKVMRKFGLVLLAAITLTGCAADRLRENTLSAGVTTTDVIYEMVLSNIAMVRYYHGAAILPSYFSLSSGQVAVNQSAGLTAGASLGGLHGLVVPNVSVPATAALQAQLNLIPSTSIVLLMVLEKKYQDENSRNHDVYHDGIPPPATLSGGYRGYQVWVDPDNKADMNHLTRFVITILGGNDIPAAENPGNSIYDLRRQQEQDQNARGANAIISPSIK